MSWRPTRARGDGTTLTLLGDVDAVLATFEATHQTLGGTAWNVVAVNNGKQAVASLLQGTTLTMTFSKSGTVSGSSGCNRYSGPFESDGKTLSFGSLASTRKLCATPERVMEQEASFLKALKVSTTSRVEGDRLELRDAKGSLQISATRAAAAPLASAHRLELPASFVGTLLCADCEGIKTQIDLWPDQVAHGHQEWVGRSMTRDFIGRWRVDPSRSALVIDTGAEATMQLEIEGPNTLRLLDTAGKPIQSTLGYELVSDGTIRPVDLSLPLGGEMTYLADAARITLCATGRSYPIAMEAEFPRAQAAYRGAAKQPGAPMYVTFDGSIVQRPKMEGSGTETSVVIRRFVNVWPGQKCERAMADASLVDTYWRIVRLGETPVTAAEGRREPHLVLQQDAAGTRYRATVGCNQLVGGATVAAQGLTFTAGASTLVACPPPLDQLERSLGEVLGKTRRYQLHAQTLELQNSAGKPLALLEAVYF